jgi:transposase-like protein
MFIMHYSYTFQAYHFEKHHNVDLDLSKEIMFPFGTGSSATSQRIYCKQNRCKLLEFIIDETLIKVGSDYVWWLWVAIEPNENTILGIRISIERNMLVAERFIKSLIWKYAKHNISTDGGTRYPPACRFLNVEHHNNHSSIEKRFIERTIQIHNKR